jgi:hypothetical protein
MRLQEEFLPTGTLLDTEHVQGVRIIIGEEDLQVAPRVFRGGVPT